MAPVAPKQTKQEEATSLRKQVEEFCSDIEALRRFYEEITPPPPMSIAQAIKENDEEKEKQIDKDKEREDEVEADPCTGPQSPSEASGGSRQDSH
jgi:hypothetical protein